MLASRKCWLLAVYLTLCTQN